MDHSSISAPLDGMSAVFGLPLRKRLFVTEIMSDMARRNGYEQVEVPLLERATSFSEEIVGRSPWPEWDQRGCFYLTIPDYVGSYDTEPTFTEALLIPEGTISVTRWLGSLLTEYPDTVFPIKMHYVTPCFRNELLDELGRHKRRQFIQFGLEVLGASLENADTEVVYLIAACLQQLGVPEQAIRVRIGDVAVFNRLVALSGLHAGEAIRLKEILDTIAECKAGKDPGRRPALEEAVASLADDADVSEPWRSVWIDMARADDSVSVVAAVQDSAIRERLDRLGTLSDVLQTLGVDVTLDVCVVRSHEYYTGIAFEIDVVTEPETFVEVGGGGRYDHLVGRFAPKGSVESVPATGFAFGVERLVSLLDTMGVLGEERMGARPTSLSQASADILVVCSPTAGGYRDAIHIATEPKIGDRAVDIYLGAPSRWREYAAARGIAEAQTIHVGEDSAR